MVWKAPLKRPSWEKLPKFKVLYCISCFKQRRKEQKRIYNNKRRNKLYKLNEEYRQKRLEQAKQWAIRNSFKLSLYRHRYYKSRLNYKVKENAK